MGPALAVAEIPRAIADHAAQDNLSPTNDRLSQHHLRIDFDPISRLFDLASEPDGHSVD